MASTFFYVASNGEQMWFAVANINTVACNTPSPCNTTSAEFFSAQVHIFCS